MFFLQIIVTSIELSLSSLCRLKWILRFIPSGKSEILLEMEGYCWFGSDRKLKNTYDHLLLMRCSETPPKPKHKTTLLFIFWGFCLQLSKPFILKELQCKSGTHKISVIPAKTFILTTLE